METMPKPNSYRVRLLWGRWWVEAWGDYGPWRRVSRGFDMSAEAREEADRLLSLDRADYARKCI